MNVLTLRCIGQLASVVRSSLHWQAAAELGRYIQQNMKTLILIIGVILLVGCTKQIEDPQMKNTIFSEEESNKIITTFNGLDKNNRKCADQFISDYQDKVFKYCEQEGYAKNIGGGCNHIVSYSLSNTVLATAMENCGVKWRI